MKFPVLRCKNRTSFLLRAAGIALMAIAAIRVVSTYRVFNQTWDESTSVACGMEWLDQGTYTYDPKHPPLGRVASAIGLYLRGVRSAGEINVYAEGNALLAAGGRYWSNLALARLGVLPFFLLACVVTWIWTSWIWGPLAGVLATALFSLLPTVLGHAGVAMTDIVLVATLPAALFSFCGWLECPSPRRSLALGACIGLAIISKLSALIFLPFCALPLLLAYGLDARTRNSSWKVVPRIRAFALAVLVAGFVIAACYRFSFSPIRLESLSPGLDRIVGTSGPAHDVLYAALETPIPAGAFFQGMDELRAHNKEGHPNYFLGQIRTSGWWYYYPVVIAVKTPVPFLLLVLLGIVFIVGDRSVNKEWRALTLVVSTAGIFAVGLMNHVNTGIRHILPIYAMLAGIAAYGALRLFKGSRAWVAVAALLLLWHAASSAFAHPDYLAYFNELAHGEAGTFGVDSDLDWGQDVLRLQQACVRHHVDSLAIAYNGSANLYQFGLPQLRPLTPGSVQNGWVSISMYKLKLGLPGQADAFSWLERFQPVELVGKSIRLYYVPPTKLTAYRDLHSRGPRPARQ